MSWAWGREGGSGGVGWGAKFVKGDSRKLLEPIYKPHEIRVNMTLAPPAHFFLFSASFYALYAQSNKFKKLRTCFV